MEAKTVAQHLADMPEGEAKEKALANVDTRYSDEKTFTLAYALTFGVNCPLKSDWLFWEDYINNLTRNHA